MLIDIYIYACLYNCSHYEGEQSTHVIVLREDAQKLLIKLEKIPFKTFQAYDFPGDKWFVKYE